MLLFLLETVNSNMVDVVAECENRKWAETIAKRMHDELGYYIVVDEVPQQHVHIKTGKVELDDWMDCGAFSRVLRLRGEV